MDKPTEAVRAVIVAARTWRANIAALHLEPAEEALLSAVADLEEAIAAGEPNKPTGFVLTRPWELVPAGWFVRTPNGEWWEVFGTALLDGKQEVSMKSPAGKRVGPHPRDPKAEVKVRRGTHTTKLDDAIEALSDVFGGVEIIEDGKWKDLP